MQKNTIWVFGDQLNRHIGALRGATPGSHRVLIIESEQKIASKRWHVQRAHFIVASMRRFAKELTDEGFEVDYRFAKTMRSGLEAHMADFQPGEVVATEPNSYSAREMLKKLPVRSVESDQFLCHPDVYREFMGARKTVKMEDFYRWQRKRLSVLMDGDAPVAGRWNFDEDNRQPPPKTDHDRWPVPESVPLDEIDQQVLADVAPYTWGAAPTGLWATSRSGALLRLKKFVTEVLPMFGEHEDAMLKSNWHLAHSLLSPYLNNGLLLPGEVVDAVLAEFEKGNVPINSAEGFLRQVIGWREYIWNCYWQWMPNY
ncbi:MAG: cryptochrome/photolyase family protein, partial [Ilumatobacteraceae bacterium]|nr:cryptochrome/photolyase family protein [Ilumatobacteraceae bacterium]